MKLIHADEREDKGWYIGPWNSDLPLSIGFANKGIDEPHLHRQISEIYLIAQGRAELRIGQDTVAVSSGDVLVVEPGEGHTFLNSSEEYFHFVIHTPGLRSGESQEEKQDLDRTELGLGGNA